jgi:hypothetical protein
MMRVSLGESVNQSEAATAGLARSPPYEKALALVVDLCK